MVSCLRMFHRNWTRSRIKNTSLWTVDESILSIIAVSSPAMSEVSNEWLNSVLKLLKGVWCARRRHGRFNVIQAHQHLSMITSDSALISSFVTEPNNLFNTAHAPYRKLPKVYLAEIFGYFRKHLYIFMYLYLEMGWSFGVWLSLEVLVSAEMVITLTIISTV